MRLTSECIAPSQMLIDIHTHLDSFTPGDVSDILSRSHAAGVGMVFTAGATIEASARSVKLSSLFDDLFAGVGIHPMDLTGPVDDVASQQLRELAISSAKVVVVSEIGLDFTEGTPDRAIQYQAFREQIRLAIELDLPIVFHSRDSHPEVLRVLREEQAYEVGGAMHYFQADLQTAREAIDLGFFVSLARPLLRLPALQEVAKNLPLEHIVLETDAAPQPFKAKRENWTEPRHVADVATKLAELKGVSRKEIDEATTENVARLLGDRWPTVASGSTFLY